LPPRSGTIVSVANLLVIEHDDDAPAGLLGDWAIRRGLSVTTLRLHAGDLPPRDPACDAAAVLGSEQTAWDDALPWLSPELEFVARLAQDRVPVLGICFGGQLLARALGARLYRLAEPEIGWVRLQSRHPGLSGGPWPSWHRDGFELPSGAVELARNEAGVQAFSLGPLVGVQFHPEVTEPIIASWVRSSGEAALGPFGDEDGAWAGLPARAAALFGAWLDGDLAGKPA
jgi:GMP synthase-like glutamine amidotransferase